MPFTIPNESGAGINAHQADPDREHIEMLRRAFSGGVGLFDTDNQTKLQVLPQATPDMTVRITTAGEVTGGVASTAFAQRWQAITTKSSIAIAANASGNPRFDIVYAAYASDSVAVAQGTPAAVPELPAIDTEKVPLALIYVPDGVSAITADHITDLRVFNGNFMSLFLHNPNQLTPPTSTGNRAHVWAQSVGGVLIPHFRDAIAGESAMLGGVLGMILAKGTLGTYTPRENARDVEGLWQVGGGADPAGAGAGVADGQWDATHGVYARHSTGSTSGNEAGVHLWTPGAGPHSRNTRFWMAVKLSVPDVSSARVFVGLAEQAFATILGADAPAASRYFGFQYSTTRATANWYISRSNAGAQTANDTGIAVTNGTEYTLLLASLGAFSIAVIFDANFAQVYGALISGGNMPTTTQRLNPLWGIETQTGAVRDLDTYKAAGGNYV